jgi:hypothetical protein
VLLTRLRIIMKSTLHYAPQIQESHELAEISELVQTIDSCGQSRVRNSIVVRGHEMPFYRDRDTNCRNSANLGSKYIYVDIRNSFQ